MVKQKNVLSPHHKAFSTNVAVSNDEERTVWVKASTSTTDREGEALVALGCDSKDWEKNPVIMLQHDYYNLPIGKGLAIKRSKDSVDVKFRFADKPDDFPEDKEWIPDTVFSLFKQGVMNAVSVGLLPVETRAPTTKDLEQFGDECRNVVSKWKLLELSVVSIPCNQNAVAVAVSKGIISKPATDKFFRAKKEEGELSVSEVVKSLKSKSDREPLEQTYTQFIRNGDAYSPIGPVKLEPGLSKDCYRVCSTLDGPKFVRMQPQTDELYTFENSVMSETLKEIDKFWGLKADYEKMGLLHNRGLILYGVPGTGKTAILHQVAEMIVNNGDPVFYAKSIYALTDCLSAFREIEPDRKIVVMLEDADEYVGYEEREFLQLLDGEKSISGVLYLATTNYLNRFPARLLRPGRFDKKILVEPPPYEGRLTYLKNKLKDVETESEIERLANRTDGFTFGHLRELITACYVLKEPEVDVLARLGTKVLESKVCQKDLNALVEKLVEEEKQDVEKDGGQIVMDVPKNCVGCLKEFKPDEMTQDEDGDWYCAKCMSEKSLPAKEVIAEVTLEEDESKSLTAAKQVISDFEMPVVEETNVKVICVNYDPADFLPSVPVRKQVNVMIANQMQAKIAKLRGRIIVTE